MNKVIYMNVKHLAVVIISCTLSCADLLAQDRGFKAEQNFPGGFEAVEIEGGFDVKMENADYYGAEWTCPEEIKDEVHVFLKGDVLLASFTKKGFDASGLKKLVGGTDGSGNSIVLTIYAPSVNSIVASGSASIDADGFSVETDKFMLDITDNVSLSGLGLKASSATITVSKKARLQSADVEAGNLSVNSANMAEVSLKQLCKALSIQANGTSVLDINGSSETADVSVYNSSRLKLSGAAADFNLTAAGREVHAEDFSADDVKVVGSNACKTYVDAADNLSIELKGGSLLSYSGSPVVDIVRIQNSSVSRVSSGL